MKDENLVKRNRAMLIILVSLCVLFYLIAFVRIFTPVALENTKLVCLANQNISDFQGPPDL